MNSLEIFLTKSGLRVSAKRKLRFDLLIMLIGIVISVAVVCAAISLFEGYQRSLRSILLDSNSHIIISPYSNHMLSPQEADGLLEKLHSDPALQSATPTFSHNVLLRSPDKLRSALLRAYPVESKDNWFSPFIVSGSTSLRPGFIIIGSGLSAFTSSKLGDSLALLYTKMEDFSPAGMHPYTGEFKIGGIIKTGYYELDNGLILMSDIDAFNFFSIKPGYTHLEVFLRENYLGATTKITNRFKQILGPSYLLQNWIDLNGNLFALIEMEKWLLFIVFSFLILIAALNCVSSVSTSILDRKKEIAVLKALGLGDKIINNVFYYRIMMICLIAIVLGLALGTLTAWLITMQSFYQLKGDVYFIEKLNMHVSIINYLAVFCVAFALVMVCTRIPLKAVSKLDPVQILRGC